MSRLVVALRDRTVVARADGDGWIAQEVLEGKRPLCLAVDPLLPNRLYCGTADHGLWLSDDAGDSWREAGAGVREARITAVATSTPGAERADLGPAIVYVGTEPSALYRSEDGGGSWQALEELRNVPSAPSWSFPPRPETHHVRWVEIDPHRPQRVFACIEAGALLRSDDGGRSWRDRVPGGPHDTHTLASHRALPGRLYAAAGDGYFESDDAGESWRQPEVGLRYRYLFGVAADPANPETVLVSAAPGPRQAYNPGVAESAVYRKQGGGRWEEVRSGLPPGRGTTVSVLTATAAGVFWAANNRGVFRSHDAGLSWERLAVSWPEPSTTRDVVALAVLGSTAG